MKKGDKIVCINDKHTDCPLKEGMMYVINDIMTCPTCGMVEFKLSIPHHNHENGKCNLRCASCKTYFESAFWYSEHWRFKKLEEATEENININIESKKVVKEFKLIAN